MESVISESPPQTPLVILRSSAYHYIFESSVKRVQSKNGGDGRRIGKAFFGSKAQMRYECLHGPPRLSEAKEAYQSFYDMYDIIAIGGLNEMREIGRGGEVGSLRK